MDESATGSVNLLLTAATQQAVTLRREQGFEGIEIDSSPGNAYGISERAHR